MAVDKLSDEDLERLRKAADVAAMKARAAVEGSLSKAVDDTTQALVDARGAEEKAKAGFFAAEAEVKEAVKTLEWEQGCVASRRFSFVCFSVHGREDCTRTYLLYSSMIMLLQLLAIR